MKLERLDEIVELCKAHVKLHQSELPEIDSFLAQYLVVLIAGVYEETIEQQVRERVSKLKDAGIVNLVASLVHNSFRNPRYDSIAELLGKFGEQAKSNLKDNALSEDIDALNSIMNNRQAIAHGKDASVTMNDVVAYYAQSKKVIALVNEIIMKIT